MSGYTTSVLVACYLLCVGGQRGSVVVGRTTANRPLALHTQTGCAETLNPNTDPAEWCAIFCSGGFLTVF
jgi:hypothetical protein